MPFFVEAEGLRTLRTELKATDAEFPKELTKTHKAISQDLASAIQSAFPRLTGRAAATVRGRGSQVSASVTGGGAKAPEFGVTEFGGTLPRRGHSGDPTVRTHVKAYKGPTSKSVDWWDDSAGYSMFPTARNKREQIVDQYAEMLDTLTSRLFPGA